jgi:hypothetical protein
MPAAVPDFYARMVTAGRQPVGARLHQVSVSQLTKPVAET